MLLYNALRLINDFRLCACRSKIFVEVDVDVFSLKHCMLWDFSSSFLYVEIPFSWWVLTGHIIFMYHRRLRISTIPTKCMWFWQDKIYIFHTCPFIVSSFTLWLDISSCSWFCLCDKKRPLCVCVCVYVFWDIVWKKKKRETDWHITHKSTFSRGVLTE